MPENHNMFSIRILTLLCLVLLFSVTLCHSTVTNTSSYAMVRTSTDTTSIMPITKGELTNKGIALLNLGKYNESIPYFDKALAIDPNEVNALTQKGVALVFLKRANQSIPYFDKALAINPKDVSTLTNKGLALGRLGKYNESISYFDKALAINPKFGVAMKEKEDVVAAASAAAAANATALSRGQSAAPTNQPGFIPESTFGYYFNNSQLAKNTTAKPTNAHKLH